MKSRLPQITLGRLRAYIKVLCLFLTAIAAYWRDLLPLLSEALKSEMTNYIVAVPFMVSFVLYQKRRRLQAAITWEEETQDSLKPIKELIGLALCLFAFLLYGYGSRTFYPLEYHLASIPLFLSGCTLFIFNQKMLEALAFPIL